MAYTNEQLRGALLEETILYLLKNSGYTIVLQHHGDPTLKLGPAGLEVMGRGAWHQLDAVADFKLTPPFSNPHRLLLEAKFYSSKIGLPIVRNTASVLRDVSESWSVDLVRADKKSIAKKRYHYMFALFSSSDFTVPSQEFAYAHDIYLLPLKKSTFFEPIIRSLEMVSIGDFNGIPPLKTIRNYMRGELLGDLRAEEQEEIPGILPDILNGVINACRQLSYGFITNFGGQFPTFLVAGEDFRPNNFNDIIDVRIKWRDGSWFIEDQLENQIFSFDLPETVFERYAIRGQTNREMVRNIKGDLMSEFYSYHFNGERLRLLQFRLDRPWFESINERIRNRNP